MNDGDLKKISNLLDEKLTPVKKTLGGHSDELKQHGTILKEQSTTLKQHGTMLKQQGKLLRSLKKDQDTMLNMLDTEQMKQTKRLKRVEEHLGLPSHSV